MIINTDEKNLGKVMIKIGIALSTVAARLVDHPDEAAQLSEWGRNCEHMGRTLVPVPPPPNMDTVNPPEWINDPNDERP